VPLRTGWNKLILSRANFYPQGGATEADWANIGLVRIIVASVAGQTVSCTFDDFRMVQDRFAGKVTLRFDDVFLSIYTEARERMDAYGFRGVAPVFIDAVGTEGKMTLSQLAHLQERGWDIVSHSLTHADLTALTLGEVDRELRVSQEWLIERGFYKGSRFFVPPYHKWEPWVIDLVSKYYLGCQTVVSEPTQGAGHDTLPPFDPLHMMVREVWNTTTVATVQGWIDDCIRTQSWLTILFHNLVSPAGAQYEYTPADFQSIIDYLYTNGVEVVTFSDVFDDLMGAKFGFSHTQLLEFGVQGAITPNATSYPCPGGGVAAQTATEIRVPISRAGWLKNLRVRQRVASGAAGRTDIYTVRVNGVDTALTCTLDNATVGSDLVHSAFVSPGDLVSVSLVSNNVADASADVSVTVELEVLM
jgi:peptidoglycan/xylan/chitin deacetylase (PgdA/CDA1 family)